MANEPTDATSGRLEPLILGAVLTRLEAHISDPQAVKDLALLRAHIEASTSTDEFAKLISANASALTTTTDVLRQITPFLEDYRALETRKVEVREKEISYALHRQDSMFTFARGVWNHPATKQLLLGLVGPVLMVIGALSAWLAGWIQVMGPTP